MSVFFCMEKEISLLKQRINEYHGKVCIQHVAPQHSTQISVIQGDLAKRNHRRIELNQTLLNAASVRTVLEAIKRTKVTWMYMIIQIM